jgi:hypothetical protein
MITKKNGLRTAALLSFAGLLLLSDRQGTVAHLGVYLSAAMLVVAVAAAMTARLAALR